jgi:hypothetical protein
MNNESMPSSGSPFLYVANAAQISLNTLFDSFPKCNNGYALITSGVYYCSPTGQNRGLIGNNLGIYKTTSATSSTGGSSGLNVCQIRAYSYPHAIASDFQIKTVSIQEDPGEG